MSAEEEEENARRLASLLKVIADADRLRLIGLLAERARSDSELSMSTGLALATIDQHLRKLVKSGIVIADVGALPRVFSLDTELLLVLRRLPLDEVVSDPESGDAGSLEDQARRTVIRNFYDGDRLMTIPARQKQKRIVFEQLVAKFAPDTEYSEREVNDILRESHDDVASLRRYLVDFGFMTRERGIYRLLANQLEQPD